MEKNDVSTRKWFSHDLIISDNSLNIEYSEQVATWFYEAIKYITLPVTHKYSSVLHMFYI